jgi:hypothetical protein
MHVCDKKASLSSPVLAIEIICTYHDSTISIPSRYLDPFTQLQVLSVFVSLSFIFDAVLYHLSLSLSLSLFFSLFSSLSLSLSLPLFLSLYLSMI